MSTPLPSTQQAVAALENWSAELAEFERTKVGPDGSRFPPQWPIRYGVLAELFVGLARETGRA